MDKEKGLEANIFAIVFKPKSTGVHDKSGAWAVGLVAAHRSTKGLNTTTASLIKGIAITITHI